MKISVITINYNGLSDTRVFLGSFRKEIQGVEYEIIVVDNASVNNEAKILEDEFDGVICVRSDVNLGFSGGNNLGVKYSTGELLLFINNDIIIKSNFILPLLEKIHQDTNIAAISPQIRYMDNTLCYGGCEPIDKYLLRIHYLNGSSVSQEVSLMHGAAVIIKKDVLNKIGGWPEIYFLYSEEVDLSIHIRNLGFSIWYEPQSIVYHVGSQSTGKDSSLVCYYNTRNRLLLYKRNLYGLTRLISILYQLLVINLSTSLNLILKGEIDLFKAVCQGVIDFLCGNFYKKK